MKEKGEVRSSWCDMFLIYLAERGPYRDELLNGRISAADFSLKREKQQESDSDWKRQARRWLALQLGGCGYLRMDPNACFLLLAHHPAPLLLPVPLLQFFSSGFLHSSPFLTSFSLPPLILFLSTKKVL